MQQQVKPQNVISHPHKIPPLKNTLMKLSQILYPSLKHFLLKRNAYIKFLASLSPSLLNRSAKIPTTSQSPFKPLTLTNSTLFVASLMTPPTYIKTQCPNTATLHESSQHVLRHLLLLPVPHNALINFYDLVLKLTPPQLMTNTPERSQHQVCLQAVRELLKVLAQSLFKLMHVQKYFLLSFQAS